MSNWKKYKLGEIVESVSKTHSLKKDKIIFLNTSDILEGKVLEHSYTNVIGLPGQAKKSIQKNDILFSEIRPANKRYAYVNFNADDFVVSTKLMVLRKKSDALDFKFFYTWLTSEPVLKELQNIAESRSGTFPQITFDIIKNIEINAPSDKETQFRIASILSSLDDKIELNRRMNQTLEQLAQALFNHYFVDNINPDNLPEGWKMGRLGEVCNNIRNNISHNQINNDTVYVGLEHLPRKSLALYEAGNSENLGSNKFQFKENDILFGRLRPYFHKVVFAPSEGVCSTDILVIEPKRHEYYAYSLLHFYSEEIIEYSTQFSHGTRMPRVDWASLSRYEVAIPPISIAGKFNKIILPLLDKIKAGIKETKILTVLRDTLLPKLMSGEIDVDTLMKEETLFQEEEIENIKTA